jgi:hypothetical protein
VITDFVVGEDLLQLEGSASGYYLDQSGLAGVMGVGLYAERGQVDELIAVINSMGDAQPTADNTIMKARFV